MFLVDGAKDVYRAHIRPWWCEYLEWCCKLFYDFKKKFVHGLSQLYYAFTIIHMLFLIFLFISWNILHSCFQTTYTYIFHFLNCNSKCVIFAYEYTSAECDYQVCCLFQWNTRKLQYANLNEITWCYIEMQEKKTGFITFIHILFVIFSYMKSFCIKYNTKKAYSKKISHIHIWLLQRNTCVVWLYIVCTKI